MESTKTIISQRRAARVERAAAAHVLALARSNLFSARLRLDMLRRVVAAAKRGVEQCPRWSRQRAGLREELAVHRSRAREARRVVETAMAAVGEALAVARSLRTLVDPDPDNY